MRKEEEKNRKSRKKTQIYGKCEAKGGGQGR